MLPHDALFTPATPSHALSYASLPPLLSFSTFSVPLCCSLSALLHEKASNSAFHSESLKDICDILALVHRVLKDVHDLFQQNTPLQLIRIADRGGHQCFEPFPVQNIRLVLQLIYANAARLKRLTVLSCLLYTSPSPRDS